LSRVRLWDVASGKVRASPQDARGLFGTVAFSPDGRMLAYGAGDGTIKLWDVAEGKERATLKGAAKGSCSLAFSPDGKVVACAGLGGDPQTGEQIARLVLWDVPGQKNLGSLPLKGA